MTNIEQIAELTSQIDAVCQQIEEIDDATPEYRELYQKWTALQGQRFDLYQAEREAVQAQKAAAVQAQVMNPRRSTSTRRGYRG